MSKKMQKGPMLQLMTSLGCMHISALRISFCFMSGRRAAHNPAQMVAMTGMTNGRNSEVLCMTTCSRASSLCSLGAICTSSKWLAVAGQAAIGFNAAPDFICSPARKSHDIPS